MSTSTSALLVLDSGRKIAFSFDRLPTVGEEVEVGDLGLFVVSRVIHGLTNTIHLKPSRKARGRKPERK